MELIIKTNNPYIIDFYENKFYQTPEAGIELVLFKDIVVPARKMGFEISFGFSTTTLYENNKNHGFFIIPTDYAAKTPLRLSTSIAVIDYNNYEEINILVDNLEDYDYYANKGDKLFKICSYNLSPINVTVLAEN
tara:strand:+ start:104 stop:508 length:405 start_codon:yes stop_codon:yes gene_type:complete